MKTFIFALLTVCCWMPMQAQQNKQNCSENEFRSKKEAYLTEKAQLTPEEAAKIFPLYFELQKQKDKNNSEAWQKVRNAKQAESANIDYDSLLNVFIEVDEKNIELDKEYMKKFKELLPAKKIFQLYRAEIKFNRNMLKIVNQNKKE